MLSLGGHGTDDVSQGPSFGLLLVGSLLWGAGQCHHTTIWASMAIWVAFSTGVGQILAKTWYFPLFLVLDMALCCFASWVASKGATGEGERGTNGRSRWLYDGFKKQKVIHVCHVPGPAHDSGWTPSGA